MIVCNHPTMHKVIFIIINILAKGTNIVICYFSFIAAYNENNTQFVRCYCESYFISVEYIRVYNRCSKYCTVLDNNIYHHTKVIITVNLKIKTISRIINITISHTTINEKCTFFEIGTTIGMTQNGTRKIFIVLAY